ENAALDFSCQIQVKNPKLAFALSAEVLHPPKQRPPEIHSSSVIAKNAKLGRDVFIGAFVCVGENSTVGDRTQVRAGAKIGDNVTVDRKSTRLNSSHVKISYAVFCLKKKTRTDTEQMLDINSCIDVDRMLETVFNHSRPVLALVPYLIRILLAFHTLDILYQQKSRTR